MSGPQLDTPTSQTGGARNGPHRRPLYEGRDAWLWYVGTARMGILLIAIVGSYSLRSGAYEDWEYFRIAVYGFALATGLLYLATLKRSKPIPALVTWTQVLVDFSAVAATVSFTGGPESLFTFLFVIVILEAGLLQGLAQGFVFATLAAIFMAIQAAVPPVGPLELTTEEWIELWYRFVIQGLAFYLSAFVSGRWNQRITRLEEFQRSLLDNMNNGFLMTDHAGVITVINRMGSQILGLAEGQAVGRRAEEVLRGTSGSECPIRTVLRTRSDFISYEFHVLAPDGQTKLLGLTTSQLQEHGRLTGVIASFTDLTEIALMREDLQRQDRLALVGELAAGLAHEIRNPVASIRGAVDELRSSLSTPDIAGRLAAIALRESDHLNDIVSGFLNFARNPIMRRETFDLRALITETRELLLRDFAGEEHTTISTTLPDEACRVSGDRSQIKRVFINLAKNASEAMGGGGILGISIVPSPTSFEIRFDDEGPGITPDQITRVFEPFYTQKEGGVGMGLAVCLRIVTAHDGTIRAVPREGGGATMAVRLPAAAHGAEKE